MKPNPFILSGFFLAASGNAIACCSAASLGNRVVFNGQTNLVIWDSKTKVEHFVRQAKFMTESTDFGFIAPTPSKPELVEVDPKVFSVLSPPTAAMMSKGPPTRSSKSANAVIVVQEKDVAGYRAVTLLASDSKGLQSWLKKNGYVSTPGIEEWSKLYIKKGWYLTAFKIIGRGGPKVLMKQQATGTIRMTFKSERPFNPFYVPKENLNARSGTGLKLLLVTDKEMTGNVGMIRNPSNQWVAPRGRLTLFPEIKELAAKMLKLPKSELARVDRVVEFRDEMFGSVKHRQNTDDLFFFDAPKSAWVNPSSPQAGLALGSLLGCIRSQSAV